MYLENLPQLIKETEGIVHIRCAKCLCIVIGKDEQGRYWLPSFEHRCWDGVEEVEVERLYLGGSCGELVTVREKGGKDDN